MLSDFFRINLPYGMKKNSQGEWLFFNREYMPLGWNSKDEQENINAEYPYANLPIHTKYKGLTEATLLKLAWDKEYGIRRNEKDEIVQVFFYNDGTNPQSQPKYWQQYFQKIRLLSKCRVKNELVY